MRVAPMGFYFQRLSLPGSEDSLAVPLPFMSFPVTRHSAANRRKQRDAVTPRVCASEKSVTTSPVLPGTCRPILS